MSKQKSKLVIHVSEIQVECDAVSLAASERIVAGFLQGLQNLYNDLNSQGIDTTITVGGVPLDYEGFEESR